MRKKIEMQPYWLVVTVFAVAMTLSLALFPRIQDDLNYSLLLRSWIDGSVSSPWPGIWETWQLHWHTDNIRLGNLLFSLSLLLPQRVSALALVIIFVLWQGFTAHLSGASARSGRVALGIAALIYFLPYWNGAFAGDCFRFNYIWGGVVALWAVVLFNEPRGRRQWSMLLWGLVVGWWHEGFAVPLLCGMCAVVLMDWRCRASRMPRLWLMAGLALGVVILMSAPGPWVRAGGWDMAWQISGVKRIAIPVALACVCVMAVLARAGYRSRIDLRLLVLLAVSIGASVLLTWRFSVARTGWWAGVGSIVVICMCVRVLPSRRTMGRMAVVGGAAALIFSVVGAVGAALMRPLVTEAYASVARERSATVYADALSPFESPLTAFMWPSYYTAMYYPISRDIVGEYNYLPGPVTFVPCALLGVTADTGDPVPGAPGLRREGNFFFLPADNLPSGESPVMMRFDMGRVAPVYAIEPQYFVSSADGRGYAWLVPGDGRIVLPFSVRAAEYVKYD